MNSLYFDIKGFLIPACLFVALELRFWLHIPLCSPDHMGCYAAMYHYPRAQDSVSIHFLDSDFQLLQSIQYTNGDTQGGCSSHETLGQTIRKHRRNASYFFLAHTHGAHGLTPSSADRSTHAKLAQNYTHSLRYLGQVIVNDEMGYAYFAAMHKDDAIDGQS